MPSDTVPKPVKKSAYRVDCSVCGTHGWYTFVAFDSHAQWCAAAKRAKDAAAKKKTAKSNSTPHRR